MRFQHLYPLALVGIVVTLMGCGQVPPGYFDRFKTSDDSSGLPQMETSAANLQGSWASECWADPATPGTRFKETWVIYGGGMTAYRHVYADDGCLAELYSLTFSGSYALGTNVLAERWSYVLVTPIQSVAVEAFNRNRFCGKSNWSLQPTQFSSVTTCGYPALRTVSMKLYGKAGGDHKMVVTDGNLTIQYRR